MQNERYVVGPETMRMLELGHPWVIADRFTKRWPRGRAGEVITLSDEKGKELATALLDPGERIVARVLGLGRVRFDQSWVRERIERAAALRYDHADLDGTTAWRLVNGEGDGLPGLTVECYGEHLMIQLYTAAWGPHLPLVTSALQQVLSPTGIYEKFRPQKTRELAAERQDKKYSRLLAGEPAPGRVAVRENGLEFLVTLEEELNTGLFLDQRVNRRDLMARCRSKRSGNFSTSTSLTRPPPRKTRSVSYSSSRTSWPRRLQRPNSETGSPQIRAISRHCTCSHCARS